ncbi:MAG: hypothetical protein ACKVT0_03425 [Planctomycetaceae bacterium]
MSWLWEPLAQALQLFATLGVLLFATLAWQMLRCVLFDLRGRRRMQRIYPRQVAQPVLPATIAGTGSWGLGERFKPQPLIPNPSANAEQPTLGDENKRTESRARRGEQDQRLTSVGPPMSIAPLPPF